VRAIPLMFVSFAMVRGQLLGVGHLSRDAARWALESLARPSFGRSVRRGASARSILASLAVPSGRGR
jgi:hypothetical protein